MYRKVEELFNYFKRTFQSLNGQKERRIIVHLKRARNVCLLGTC